MNITTKNAVRTAIAIAAGALMIHSGWAAGPSRGDGMQDRDPARWYQEDTTPRAHFQTSQKEAGAAYKEALDDCKREERTARAERAACLRRAATQYDEAMAEARQARGSR
jgi:delta 1-pyrroline-5-carboxylate dehydrogenase